MPRITPNLWFDTQGLEAAEFYVSVFPNSKVTNVTQYGEAGPREAGSVMTVEFVLDGQEYIALNGGPDFTFNEALSLVIDCADQDEVDYYWSRLSEVAKRGRADGSRTATACPGRSCPLRWSSCSATPTRGVPSGRCGRCWA